MALACIFSVIWDFYTDYICAFVSQEQPPIAGSVDRRMHTVDRRMDLKNLIVGSLNMLIGVYIFVSR